MKICIITEYFPPFVGGPPSWSAVLADGLHKKGFNITVISGDFPGSKKFDRGVDYNVIRIPFPKFKRMYALSFIFKTITKRINWDKFDVIHAFNPPSAIPVKNKKAKLVTTLCGFYKESFGFFSKTPFVTKISTVIERKAIEKSDHITSVSHVLAKHLANEYKRPVEYIGCPIDTDTFRPMKLKRDQKTIMYAGHLYPLKNVDSLIKSMKTIRNELGDIKLFIAGDGVQRKELENLTSNLGLDKCVIFLGNKTHKELAKHYNKSEFLILPSKTEALPLVVLEAMACGTPVIATPVGDIPYIIDKKFLIKNDNEMGIAETVINNFKRDIDRNRIRDKIKKQYSRDIIVDKYIRLYNKVL